jgi:hypothetical protein
VAVPSLPPLQLKAPNTFLLGDNLEDSGLAMMLNLSQLVCHWHTLDQIYPQGHIREATITSDVRVLVLDPMIFGLTTNWTVCQPELAIPRMRHQYEVFIDRLAVV